MKAKPKIKAKSMLKSQLDEAVALLEVVLEPNEYGGLDAPYSIAPALRTFLRKVKRTEKM